MNDTEQRLWRDLQNELAQARRARDAYGRALRAIAPRVAQRLAEELEPVPPPAPTTPTNLEE
jgi:hypothetical protein